MNVDLYKYLADPFERASKTFAQTYLVILLGGGSIDLGNRVLFAQALLPAAFAGLIALVTSYVAILVGVKVTGSFDLVRRVLLTFGQAFLGVIVASQVTDFISAPWESAAAAGLAAAITCLLGALGTLSSARTLGASSLRVNHVPVQMGINPDEV